MGTDVVVLVAKAIQPSLILRIGTPFLDGALQSSMHSLDFPLCLGMTDPTIRQPNPQPHDPHRQFRQPPWTGAVPPRRPVIEQHDVRQPRLPEGRLQSAS